MAKECDILVIGGGPAGYVGAIRAAQLGAKTILVEKDELGGTCLNRGCIPTKALLKTAELVHEISLAPKRGVTVGEATVDMAAVIREKNRVVKKLTGGVGALLKANAVEVIKAEGKIDSVSADSFVTAAGEIIRAKKVILAGGSRTARLPIPGIESEGVMDSSAILDMTEIPKQLAIIGGGVIGVEMAMIFNSFGSNVTVIEAMPRILPLLDCDISALIHSALAGRGVTIYTGISLSKIETKSDSRRLTLFLNDGTPVSADKALVSIGRTGDLSAAGNSGVKHEKGRVLVNDYMESSVSGIFAPGDINGKKMLAHAAFAMAECAVENAWAQINGGAPKKAHLEFVPSAVYSFPEAASVGLSEEEAKAGGPVLVGKFPLAANGRALASGAAEGFVKVIAEPKYGEIMGVHIAGQSAAEIINEAAALMAMEITVHELADLIHGHPTVSEALMEASADALGRCLHLPPRAGGLG
ncbi:MAG: dihydrolipoyl dehydrogenase [Treponema sp.]|jgi:dihydrolipoamide dehydrogenase|nr:dihydrolipoyl dehydrogenase [Treponema sp.]